MKKFKAIKADTQIWLLQRLYIIKSIIKELVQELKVPESSDVRIFCFVLGYLFLSLFLNFFYSIHFYFDKKDAYVE